MIFLIQLDLQGTLTKKIDFLKWSLFLSKILNKVQPTTRRNQKSYTNI